MLFDCSSTTAAPQQQQQPPAAAPAAGSSREQQAAAGISRQQQTQADAAVSATAAVQQLAASQQPETYSKLFVGDFRRDVPASGNAYFGLRSSFRAMVFPRPGGPCLCGHSSSSSRCRPSVAWGFLAGSRLFEGSAAPAAAAASSQHRETYSKVSRRFQKGRSVPETSISDSIRPSGPWCFPVQEGRVFVGTAAAAAVAVSCFGSCLIAAAQQQHHSSSSSHQQQHQQQAAAGSSRQQQAAGSRRQPQAAAGSSRHQ